MDNKKKWIYAISLASVVTLGLIFYISVSFKAVEPGEPGGGLINPGSTRSCDYTETPIEVMNSWQKNGILNICQQETFINAADDALDAYAQTPQGLANLKSFMAAVNQLLADPSYTVAAKANNEAEMRRIEKAYLSPQIPNVWPAVNKIKIAFKNSGGKQIAGASNKWGIGKALALGDDGNNCKYKIDEVNDELKIEDKEDKSDGFKVDCWKPLKWPKGWESGPSPIGLPGWKGLRNPKELPGWSFGGGDVPVIGPTAIIVHPRSAGWGVAVGTYDRGWIGVGGGGPNGGGFIGISGNGSMVIGVGIRLPNNR